MMDRCLRYFFDAAEGREGIPPWDQWWGAHESVVEKTFGQTDYERLRGQKLVAARMILRRSTLPWSGRVSVAPTPYSPAVGEENLAAFERDNHLRLPTGYRGFLLAYNGGRPRPSWFRSLVLPLAGREPAEWQVLLFSHLSFDPLLVEPSCAHSLQFADQPPAGYFPVAQLYPKRHPGSDSLLLIKVADEGIGGMWCWPDKAGHAARPVPEPVAGSFDELMQSLDYPEKAKPWMELIDRADVENFRKWLDGGGDFARRDPSSGFTAIEYAAWGHDADVPLGAVHPDDVCLRQACLEIVQRLVALGTTPGRAFRHAFFARNGAIVRLLLPVGLDSVPVEDLRDVRYYLRHRPAWSDEAILKAVEKELKTRRRR
jgi:hypothetical protein